MFGRLQHGLEGVVSKVQDARYLLAAAIDWVKVTCRQRGTLPIDGFAIKDKQFDGIYIGRTRATAWCREGDLALTRAAKDLQARLSADRGNATYAKKIAHRAFGRAVVLLRSKSGEVC